MTAFAQALAGNPLRVPPIWLMRQAGRYQRSYQTLRRQHTFEALCRTPELAAEVTLGPIREFDFDAAILFSDLLFPLEAMGLGLSYDDGSPKLSVRLTTDGLTRLRGLDDALPGLQFQREAMAAARARVPREKALIGFVGGPWTLFVYATEGSHAGALARAKSSPGLYRAFADQLVPLLRENIRLQFEGGADIVMVFDTAAGEVETAAFREAIAPDLLTLATAFPGRLGYYAKGAHPSHLPALVRGPWAGMGFDSRWDLAALLSTRSTPGFVQGNFDPAFLLCEGKDLDQALEAFLAPLQRLDAETRRGWICGLGHGVLQHTPEDHVRKLVSALRKAFQ